MADENIVITFDDDEDIGTGEAPDGTKPAADPVEDLRGQLKTMQASLSTVEQRATRAEQNAQQATQRATQLEHEVVKTKTEATEARTDLISTGIEKQQSDMDRAEAAYTAAFESGDGKAMAKAQRDMSTAAARMTQLETAKANSLEARTTTTTPVSQQRTPARTDDPVEQLAASLSPASAAWVRSHPDVVTDPRKNAKMLAGHNDAVGEGIALDSPEYFKHIEGFVKGKPVDSAKDDSDTTEAKPQRRMSAPAAPVVNSSGGTSGNGAVTVSLNQKEKASATDGTLVWNVDDPTGKNKYKKGDPIGIQEFARRKHIMMKDGLYDKTLQE